MMRTKDQFKAYVYEKADRKILERKKNRKIFYRSAVSFSLLLIIGGAFVYANNGFGNTAYDAAPEMAYKEDGSVLAMDMAKTAATGSSVYGYSTYSDNLDDCAGVEVMTECSLDVLGIAEKACTVEYDTYNIEYDEEAKLWKVDFYKSNTLGGCQTVYIDTEGNVTSTVYGE